MNDGWQPPKKNITLTAAKAAKNDEFYTQYANVEKEVMAYLEFDPNVFRGKTVLLPCDDPEWSNFTRFFAQKFTVLGIKKLISTSYDKDGGKGKVFTLTHGVDANADGKTDFQDLDWEWLEGDGDFRSAESSALLAEADIVVTNPPFSLFREFLAWVTDADKKFLLIGNINGITYKESFALIKNNKLWLGVTEFNTGMYFNVPNGFTYSPTYKFDRVRDGKSVSRVAGVCWYTNLDHGRRHESLMLMTMTDNLRFNKKIEAQGEYQRYDNYDAIEVPQVKAIPSDYKGIMGVPITFLDKYVPEQFEIVGCSDNGIVPDECKLPHFKTHNEPFIDGKKVYKRLFIKHRK